MLSLSILHSPGQVGGGERGVSLGFHLPSFPGSKHPLGHLKIICILSPRNYARLLSIGGGQGAEGVAPGLFLLIYRSFNYYSLSIPSL